MRINPLSILLVLLSALLVACAPVPLTSLLRPCPEDEVDQLLSTLAADSWTPQNNSMAAPGRTLPARMEAQP
jgi:hypothetical protein